MLKAMLAVAALAVAATPLSAQGALSDPRYEVTLVFGASLLSAESDSAKPLPFASRLGPVRVR